MIVTLSTPPLSRVRTFLFGGLAVVWFSEMRATPRRGVDETLEDVRSRESPTGGGALHHARI
jgi:hypothetical protein